MSDSERHGPAIIPHGLLTQQFDPNGFLATADNYAVLRGLIGDIVACGDGNYDERNRLVLMALVEAGKRGLVAGIRFDKDEPDWPVVLIELPTGQVSWHIKGCEKAWDGHDTATKWLRCAQFLADRNREQIHVR